MTAVKKGAVDQSFYFKLVDSAAGTPKTALTIANIDATYVRNRSAAVKNDLTALAAATTAHTDNMAIEIDATNAPGLYRIDFPDAAFATGVDKVILSVTCAGADPAMMFVDLVDNETVDVYSRLGAPAGASIAADIAGVQADTDNIQTRIPAALVSGRIDASVGSMAADVLTAAATAADFTTEVTSGLSTLTAAGVRTAIGLASANLDTQLGVIAGYIDTEIGTLQTTATAIKAKTDLIPASPAATGDAMTLTSGERNSVADALLARNVAGGSSAGRLVKEALYVLRNKVDVVANTLTVYGTDDSTAAFTADVTTTAGNPISTIDPA